MAAGQHIRAYYVRWPNGDHTFAIAQGREQLLDLLDEVDWPATPEVKLYELPADVWNPRKPISFDFVPTKDTDDDGKDVLVVERLGHSDSETLNYAMEHCLDLADDALVPGDKFFRNTRIVYPSLRAERVDD